MSRSIPKNKNRMVDICTNPACSKLGVEQPIGEFSWRNKEHTLHHSWCKECTNRRYKKIKKEKPCLIGKRFHKLIVLESAGSRIYVYNNGRTKDIRDQFLCQCDCGNTKLAVGRDLISGHTRSCGCLAKSITKISGGRRKLPNHGSNINTIFKNYQQSAMLTKREWALTKEQFIKLITAACHYCGSPPANTQKRFDKDFRYSGIDRTNNNLGYIINNCVSCCRTCNIAKHTLSMNEFAVWLQNITSKTLINASIKIFYLDRNVDVSGVSGTGVVAIGVEMPSGRCLLEWVSDFNSDTLYNSIKDIERIHGHEGATKITYGIPENIKTLIKKKE